MHNTPEFTNVIKIHQWNSMSKEKANKTTKDIGNSVKTYFDAFTLMIYMDMVNANDV